MPGGVPSRKHSTGPVKSVLSNIDCIGGGLHAPKHWSYKD